MSKRTTAQWQTLFSNHHTSGLTAAAFCRQHTLDPSCLNYCFTGICVWLRCSIFECSIETSIRVRHNNPDFVVSVYDEPGDNPWREAQSLFGSIESSLSNSIVGLFHDADVGGG